MKVYFATSNKGKVQNAQDSLVAFGIEVEQIEMDLIESRAEDPAEIALEKAKQAYKELKRPVIVEDSGFFIEALDGFPMTHIKFSLKTLGITNILKLLKGVTNRRAEWRMTLAYVSGKETFKTFTFVEKGELATSLRPVKRSMMSDYWRLYIPKMLATNTLALSEMTEEGLESWQKYYTKNNQFMLFGKWFKKQQATKKK